MASTDSILSDTLRLTSNDFRIKAIIESDKLYTYVYNLFSIKIKIIYKFKIDKKKLNE